MRALAGRHGFIYHSTKMTQKILRLIVSVFDVTPEFFFDRDKFFSTDKYRNFGKSGTGLYKIYVKYSIPAPRPAAAY